MTIFPKILSDSSGTPNTMYVEMQPSILNNIALKKKKKQFILFYEYTYDLIFAIVLLEPPAISSQLNNPRFLSYLRPILPTHYLLMRLPEFARV